MLSLAVMAHMVSRSVGEGAGGCEGWERLVLAISESRVAAKSRWRFDDSLMCGSWMSD
jgi:hypothetical protein